MPFYCVQSLDADSFIPLVQQQKELKEKKKKKKVAATAIIESPEETHAFLQQIRGGLLPPTRALLPAPPAPPTSTISAPDFVCICLSSFTLFNTNLITELLGSH